MRIYNFSAGPAMLPLEVLEKAKDEMLDYNNSGMSVMEMSHRSKIYEDIFIKSQEDFRKLIALPDSHRILYFQGGAYQQFSAVPMNLMHTGKADYALTGIFASKAYEEAKKYGEIKAITSSKDENYSSIPKITADMIDKDSSYLHICTNNTIVGTSYRRNLPNTGDIPLVADMSSNILSEVFDYSQFGLVYAGAQKNIASAGLTVVIIDKKLISEPAIQNTPSIMRYDIFSKNNSMYNTPPTYSIYIAGLVFEHLLSNGGIPAIEKQNVYKAGLLYEALDNSKLFTPTAAKEDRSIMNVTFVSKDKETDADFVAQATENGLVNLKGHRAVGGMRASIYNAMPVEGVEKLVEFMKKYEANNA